MENLPNAKNAQDDIKFKIFITGLIDYLPYPKDFEYLEFINHLIYFGYLDRIKKHNIILQDIYSFMESHDWLIKHICTHYDKLYQQPIMCLVYYLIKKEFAIAEYLWVLTPSELAPLFSDMGISMYD